MCVKGCVCVRACECESVRTHPCAKETEAGRERRERACVHINVVV